MEGENGEKKDESIGQSISKTLDLCYSIKHAAQIPNHLKVAASWQISLKFFT